METKPKNGKHPSISEILHDIKLQDMSPFILTLFPMDGGGGLTKNMQWGNRVKKIL
jgi:hypothetical protein